jgi:hypothetical protein
MTGDAAASVTAYEALRTHVLTTTSAGNPAGLLLLLQQGVAAWMTRRAACSFSAPPVVRTGAPVVADELRAALVRILASMALADQQSEVRA